MYCYPESGPLPFCSSFTQQVVCGEFKNAVSVGIGLAIGEAHQGSDWEKDLGGGKLKVNEKASNGLAQEEAKDLLGIFPMSIHRGLQTLR